MTQISVVIITKNEEKNIGRCINSVKDIADDIVVVDSYSTDKTEDICNEKGVRFIQHKFHGYIEQKNFALTQAKYTKVLSLDADEVLSDELKISIMNVKNNWHADGYTFNRLTNYCGKWIYHCGWYPDVKLRLFDIAKGKWEGINPHDKFIMTRESKIIHIKGDLLHYSYNTINEHINQANTFANITAQALYEKNIKVSLFKIIFSPFVKFLKCYFLKLGFLDGYEGFIISKISAYATFIKYIKLKFLYKSNN